MFLVTFLLEVLDVRLQILSAFHALVPIAVRDVDVSVLAEGVQQEIAFPHAEPESIAGALRAEAEEEEREQSDHQRNSDDCERQGVVVIELIGQKNLKNKDRQDENVGNGAVDGVLPLRQRHLRRSDQDAAENQAVQHHHQRQAQNYPDRHENDFPAPREEAVELQGDEDKLQSVHRQEQLELKASLVLLLDRPNAEEHADDA